jgi:hypothetical protein
MRNDQERRELCAVCDGTNQTMQLCKRCRQDPANADWSQGSRREVLIEPQLLPLVASYSAPAGRRLRPMSERTKQIFGLLRGYSICVPLRNFGVRRAHEHWVWRNRPLNFREIAFLVGCTKQAVVKTVRKTLDPAMAQV